PTRSARCRPATITTSAASAPTARSRTGMTSTAMATAIIITTTTITPTRRSEPVPRAAPLFDTYLMVDWSAANTPKRGRARIGLCQLAGRRGGARARAAHENPATRHGAHARLREILVGALAKRRSVLVGCDFPFAYVAGLAARLGLPSPGWRPIWDTI